MKKKAQRGFTLIFSIMILAVVSAFAIFFLIAGRHATMIAKEYFYGTQARYLAEAGEETIKCRIQMDVLRKPLIDQRLDGNINGSWAEDIDVLATKGVLNQHYSTRHDDLDENGNAQIDEATEIQPIGPADRGFYAVVRDLGRGLDLNLNSPDVTSGSATATNALKYGLARFPLVGGISNDGADTLVGGGLVDAILTFRTTLGGRYRSVEQLRNVPGMTNSIYGQIKNYLTVHAPSKVISGGLIAHYYNDITGYPTNVAFDINSYAGTVIERGSGGFKVGGSFAFGMNSALDFEGTQVAPSSFPPVARPRTYSRPAIITNDASPGNPVTDTTLLTFGVRWEGFIFIPPDIYTPATSAPIAFRLRATGGARIKIAGQPVITSTQFWNSEHDGTDVSASTDFAQVSLPSGTFGIGWQPIEIEYWCNNHKPAFLLFWNEGFHFRPGSTGDPADPDVDMGAQRQLIASRSLGYKGGGVYEIRSSGVFLNGAGNIETERIV